VLLVAFHSKILFLAYGFLAANAAGILIYIWILARQLARQGLFRHFRLKELTVPFREILSFSIPLMSTDLIAVLNQSFGVLLLGYYHNMHAVALFRVVLPVAVLNKLVMTAFTLLYTPSAARLYAKRDYASVNHLYWRTAVWMSVLSFPVFAATFCFARPLTVFLYGPRYSRSGIILALLSLGYYFNVALGFNGLTIRVFGKIRYVVSINLLTAAISVLINLLLIPRYGPVGAAIGTAGTMIVHNILKQAGLRLASGISLFDRKYAGFYLLIGTSAAALTFVGFVLHTNVYLAGTLAAAVSLLVLVLARRELDITDVFPESRKLPLLGRLLASPWPRA
jgi:O-antigen/teichoic acid export membrane protein